MVGRIRSVPDRVVRRPRTVCSSERRGSTEHTHARTPSQWTVGRPGAAPASTTRRGPADPSYVRLFVVLGAVHRPSATLRNRRVNSTRSCTRHWDQGYEYNEGVNELKRSANLFCGLEVFLFYHPCKIIIEGINFFLSSHFRTHFL